MDLFNLHPFIFFPFVNKYKKNSITTVDITLEPKVPPLVPTPSKGWSKKKRVKAGVVVLNKDQINMLKLVKVEFMVDVS